MGFKLSKVPDKLEITIAFVNVNDEGYVERTPVTHIFRIPTLKEREQFERDAAKIKGRKVEVDRRHAAIKFWPKVVLDVRGYDDVEEKFPRNAAGELAPGWKDFFIDNEVLRHHVVEFVDQLFEQITGEEYELEKNSESSAEQS